MGIPNLGPKFVSGSAATGRVHFYRDDGSSDFLPFMLVFRGTVTDVTGDGIFNVDFPGGS